MGLLRAVPVSACDDVQDVAGFVESDLVPPGVTGVQIRGVELVGRVVVDELPACVDAVRMRDVAIVPPVSYPPPKSPLK
jgi:hypothetical protein